MTNPIFLVHDSNEYHVNILRNTGSSYFLFFKDLTMLYPIYVVHYMLCYC